MQTFRVLSALLCYPEQPMREALEIFAPVLEAEGALPADVRKEIDRFIAELGAGDLLDAQERYVTYTTRLNSSPVPRTLLRWTGFGLG